MGDVSALCCVGSGGDLIGGVEGGWWGGVGALLGRLTRVLAGGWCWRGVGRTALAQLEGGDVGVGVVGDEDPEAVAVVVAERQLRAGVGPLAAADSSRLFGPGIQVERELAHPRAWARLAARPDGRRPRLLGHPE